MLQKLLSLHYSVLWKFISIIMLVAIFNTGSASACFYLAIEYLDSPAYQCHSLNFWKIDPMLNTWLLCTGAELDFGAGVWGEAEKIFLFFFALPGKGGHRGLMVQKLCSNLGEFREESMVQAWSC